MLGIIDKGDYMSALENFLKATNAEGREVRTVTSDSSWAGVRHAQQQADPGWKGDRGPDGVAPPWGDGVYANGTGINPPTIEREAAAESRRLQPVGDLIFGSGGEDYELKATVAPFSTHAIMGQALKLFRSGESIEAVMQYAQEQKNKLLAQQDEVEKMEKASTPNLLEEAQEELSADDQRYKQHVQEASAAWQGGGSDLGDKSTSYDLPDISGENVKRYFDTDEEGQGRTYKPYESDPEGLVKDMDLQKLSPHLARLMAAAAGWALSDDVVRSGGGSPRGEVTAAAQREFDRAVEQQQRDAERRRRQEDDKRSAAERRRYERSMRSAMRTRKSLDDYPQFNRMVKFYSEGSDEYHRRTPLMLNKSEEIVLQKEHMPAPPRQGLVWDAVKHRWVRPENSGKTVTEVQGEKRIRGHGVGAHEKRVGGHGRGTIRQAGAGRRFKGMTDVANKRSITHPSFKGFEKPTLPRSAKGGR